MGTVFTHHPMPRHIPKCCIHKWNFPSRQNYENDPSQPSKDIISIFSTVIYYTACWVLFIPKCYKYYFIIYRPALRRSILSYPVYQLYSYATLGMRQKGLYTVPSIAWQFPIKKGKAVNLRFVCVQVNLRKYEGGNMYSFGKTHNAYTSYTINTSSSGHIMLPFWQAGFFIFPNFILCVSYIILTWEVFTLYSIFGIWLIRTFWLYTFLYKFPFTLWLLLVLSHTNTGTSYKIIHIFTVIFFPRHISLSTFSLNYTLYTLSVGRCFNFSQKQGIHVKMN